MKKNIIHHNYFIEGEKVLERCMESYGSEMEPRCKAILGPSGSGKTTMITQYAKKYPEKYVGKGWVRPVVIVEVPSIPTPKTIASELLRVLGDPLFASGGEPQMTQRIYSLIKDQQTRLLIFDEMQVLIDRESDKLNYKVAEWLKRLINQVKIPVVVVGLEKTTALFHANEQLRRRFRNPYYFRPLDWNDDKNRSILRKFLKAIFERIGIATEVDFSSKDIVYRFYCASAGLVGYIIEIIHEAVYIAKNEVRPKVRMQHLAQAYSEVVCCNEDVGVNPFDVKANQDIERALKVLEASSNGKKKING